MSKLFLLNENGMQEFIPLHSTKEQDATTVSFFEQLKQEFLLSKEETKPEVHLYTISKLVTLFETTRPTIYSWIDMGLLKPIKLGGRVYFNKIDIEELIQQKSSENL